MHGIESLEEALACPLTGSRSPVFV